MKCLALYKVLNTCLVITTLLDQVLKIKPVSAFFKHWARIKWPNHRLKHFFSLIASEVMSCLFQRSSGSSPRKGEAVWPLRKKVVFSFPFLRMDIWGCQRSTRLLWAVVAVSCVVGRRLSRLVWQEWYSMWGAWHASLDMSLALHLLKNSMRWSRSLPDPQLLFRCAGDIKTICWLLLFPHKSSRGLDPCFPSGQGLTL